MAVLLPEIYGLLGSASKRRARLYAHQGEEDRAQNALREAANWYLKGVALQAPEHWTPCQSFVLLALNCSKDGWKDEGDKTLTPSPELVRTMVGGSFRGDFNQLCGNTPSTPGRVDLYNVDIPFNGMNHRWLQQIPPNGDQSHEPIAT